MKKLSMFLVVVMLCSFTTLALAKSEVSIYWAEYDGLTPEYAQGLKAAFEKANPDIALKIVSTPWNVLHDKLITALGGNQAPDLSVIGTRWLLEFMDMDVVEPMEKYLSKGLLANIPEALMEGKLNNTLYGIPVAAGPRIMFYRTDLMPKAPETFEEMAEIVKKITKAPDMYGVGMSGKKYTELTEFAYYLYGNGGDFFAMTPEGKYGKCIVNNEAGVKALTFMNDLVKAKATQPSTLEDTRDQVQDLFVAGKLGIMMSGAFTAGLLEQRGAKFGWAPAVIPHFQGKNSAPLFITDSIVMFKASKNKEAAGKFLDFFYGDEWRLQFDKLVGFPPITKSLGKDPYFQKPLYQILVKSMEGAKAWPLVAEWPECNDIIWNAISSAFLGQKDVKKALDDAAAEIDKLRKM